MNTKLVQTLAQIILSLPEDERTLLDSELKPKPDWRETRANIINRGAAIQARRSEKPFEPSVDEIIHQMREERTEQLIQACFPESE